VTVRYRIALPRQAVLDRLLRDRLNVEQTKAAMRRDFLVALSDGFVSQRAGARPETFACFTGKAVSAPLSDSVRPVDSAAWNDPAGRGPA
jgi:hypothetical protein